MGSALPGGRTNRATTRCGSGPATRPRWRRPNRTVTFRSNQQTGTYQEQGNDAEPRRQRDLADVAAGAAARLGPVPAVRPGRAAAEPERHEQPADGVRHLEQAAEQHGDRQLRLGRLEPACSSTPRSTTSNTTGTTPASRTRSGYVFTAGSNNIYETRPDLVQSAGYTNILTNQRDLEGQVHPNRLDGGRHVLRERRRAAHVQGRRPVRAHRQRRRRHRAAAATCRSAGTQSHTNLDGTRRARHVRLLLVARRSARWAR